MPEHSAAENYNNFLSGIFPSRLRMVGLLALLTLVSFGYFHQDRVFEGVDQLISKKNVGSKDLENKEENAQEEDIDYEEFMNRLPFRKPDDPGFKNWFRSGANQFKENFNV